MHKFLFLQVSIDIHPTSNYLFKEFLEKIQMIDFQLYNVSEIVGFTRFLSHLNKEKVLANRLNSLHKEWPAQTYRLSLMSEISTEMSFIA